MVDINFSTTDCIAPTVANPRRICYTTGLNGNGNVLLAETALSCSSNGEITSEDGTIHFTNVIDVLTAGAINNVSATTATTTVDLNNGSYIRLAQSASTMITLSNLPTGGVRFFSLRRQQDATAGAYTIGFSGTHKKEGRVPLVCTNTANGIDTLFGFVMPDGRIYTRVFSNNYGLPASLVQANLLSTDAVMNRRKNRTSTPPSTKVSGVESGQLISTMANKTLNAVDIKTDGVNRITTPVELSGVVIPRRNSKVNQVTSTATLEVNMGTTDFIELDHTVDITTINFIPADPALLSTCLILRKKDATATARTIYFDPAIFKWDLEPNLIQTPSAEDNIFIASLGGINFLAVFNDFGE